MNDDGKKDSKFGRGKGWMYELPVPDDVRPKMYEKIATVHKQLVQAKWRARQANAQLRIDPSLLLHIEESVAFLAEELLKLWTVVEGEAVEPPTPEEVQEAVEALEEKV